MSDRGSGISGDIIEETANDLPSVPAISRGISGSDLFRSEAIENRLSKQASFSLRNNTGAGTAAAIASVILALCLVILCWFGQVVRTVSVSGILVARTEISNVVTPESGTIIKQFKFLGDKIHKGDVIFIVSKELDDEKNKPLLLEVSIKTKEQIMAIDEQIALENSVFNDTLRSQIEQRKISDSHVHAIERNISGILESVSRDEAEINRRENLQNAGLVKINELVSAKVQLASDKYRLASLEGSAETARLALSQADAEISQLPLSHAAKISSFQEKKASLEVSLARNEATREFAIIAPIDGTISSLTGFIGKAVITQEFLATISPPDQVLQARLFVPSSSSGFLYSGEQVAIQYTAFPYERFGYFKGHVSQIFDVALKQSDIDQLHIPISTKEPLFSILVQIDQQSIDNYKEILPLRAGMTLQASLFQEKRYIYQWILDPLFSSKGYLSFGRKEQP